MFEEVELCLRRDVPKKDDELLGKPELPIDPMLSSLPSGGISRGRRTIEEEEAAALGTSYCMKEEYNPKAS
jgi:hypothetical protein